MTKRTKQTVVIGAMAATLAIGVGVAVADGGLGSGDDRQAFLDDAAKRLHVTPTELQSALEGAYDDRLDAAVAAGKITKEQAEAMKQRFRSGPGPFPGGRAGGFGHGGLEHAGIPLLAAAATYLDLTRAELLAQLRSGRTLAQITEAQGASVDGLKKALATEGKKRLAAAVKAGRLTQAQADDLETRMAEHLGDLVNGVGHAGRERGRHFPGFGSGSPSAGETPPAFVPVAPSETPA